MKSYLQSPYTQNVCMLKNSINYKSRSFFEISIVLFVFFKRFQSWIRAVVGSIFGSIHRSRFRWVIISFRPWPIWPASTWLPLCFPPARLFGDSWSVLWGGRRIRPGLGLAPPWRSCAPWRVLVVGNDRSACRVVAPGVLWSVGSSCSSSSSIIIQLQDAPRRWRWTASPLFFLGTRLCLFSHIHICKCPFVNKKLEDFFFLFLRKLKLINLYRQPLEFHRLLIDRMGHHLCTQSSAWKRISDL